MKSKTNFGQSLVEQLKDEGIGERFKKAWEAWDVAMELTALRDESELSQKEFARRGRKEIAELGGMSALAETP